MTDLFDLVRFNLREPTYSELQAIFKDDLKDFRLAELRAQRRELRIALLGCGWWSLSYAFSCLGLAWHRLLSAAGLVLSLGLLGLAWWAHRGILKELEEIGR